MCRERNVQHRAKEMTLTIARFFSASCAAYSIMQTKITMWDEMSAGLRRYRTGVSG